VGVAPTTSRFDAGRIPKEEDYPRHRRRLGANRGLGKGRGPEKRYYGETGSGDLMHQPQDLALGESSGKLRESSSKVGITSAGQSANPLRIVQREGEIVLGRALSRWRKTDNTGICGPEREKKKSRRQKESLSTAGA